MTNLNEVGGATVEGSTFLASALQSLIERIEEREIGKRAIIHKISEIYRDAKGAGLDVNAIRTIVRMRKVDAKDRQEQEAILDTYMQAMGMI